MPGAPYLDSEMWAFVRKHEPLSSPIQTRANLLGLQNNEVKESLWRV
jgi:hypothetical protein